MSGEIRIRVGASLINREVEATFGTIEKIAERTGRNVARALGAGGSGSSNTGAAAMGRSFRAAATDADKAGKDIERAFARQVKAAEKASKDEYRAFLKAAQDKKRLAEREVADREKLAAQIARVQDQFLRQETRNAEREAKKREKLEENAAKRIARDREKFADRTSHRAVRFLVPNPIGAFGMASRIGHDILRGAGVDFSVAGSVSRAVDVESLSQQISNQGYRKGEEGPAGVRVSGKQLESEARSVGKDLSLDPHELLQAQIKFLDVTGDLDASRKNMKGLAEIAAATNTDFTAMAEAAGNVSRHLEEGPDKAEKLLGIMRVLAGQGKVGSIEIKDFAGQMAKIAAIAPKFAGDVGENITKLTTIAQLSRAEGGSATAAQAATSTARFVDIFQTPARMKKFDALGIKAYTDAKHTQLADPFEIIKQSLVKTKGDALKMADLFKSVMAQRGVAALTNAYNKAGGGKDGLAAVDSQFAIFGKESAIRKDEVTEDNAMRQATTKAQAQAFQNELDETITSMKGELVPAMKEFAPLAVQGAHALGELVAWSSHHPFQAVGAAITAAIARAGVESAFRAGIEKMIASAATTGGIQMLAPVAITIAAATIAMHLIDEDIKAREEEQRKNSIENGNAGVMENEARLSANKGIITTKSRDDLTAINANLTERIARVDKLRNNGYGVFDPNAGAGMIAAESVINPTKFAARQDSAHLAELKAELANNAAILNMIRTGTLRVIVANANEIGGNSGPKVYAPGRGPDPSNPPGPWR